jgi:1-acyl-sn-glycerol-3-phosphate acyltransferase
MIYAALRHPAALFLRLKFNWAPSDPADARVAAAKRLKPPYLVLANHTTDYDPIMVGCDMRKHMYFIASDHIYRAGAISRLLAWALAPISRVKGATDASAAMKTLKALRRGASVCVFAEGERSWNGLTGALHPSTARLARAAGVPVVTYRLSGGYLTSPRWSGRLRRGKICGSPVSVYMPETVRSMTDAQLRSAIERDIYADAFADQRASPVRYAGKALAEHLETAIFTCPKCGGVGTLKSDGDAFSCLCGLAVRFGAYGFFEGDGIPFNTVAQWDAWQETRLNELAASAPGVFFTDSHARLTRVDSDHSETETARGDMTLDASGLRIGAFHVPLERIGSMSMHGRKTIIFSASGVSYEIKCAHLCNLRKYLLLYERLAEAGAVKL